ncbi:MAG: AAA family ATPase [Woeseiaceae bacterium]|nr:AAA family ATPase [Woeseiaceae bacterium]
MNSPSVVFVIGLPGSGKTTVASKLAEFHGYPLVTTEVISARLHSVDRVKRDRDFSPGELQEIYNVMCLLTDLLLSGGCGVVVDGVFRSRDQREQIFAIAAKHGARVLGYEVCCDEQVLLERIKARKAEGTVSPAGEKAYYKIASEFEPTDGRFIRVDNSSSV